MIRKYILPVLAFAGLLFGLYTVALGAKPAAVAKPAAEPALAPFDQTIAGAGIVEARSQTIAIASARPGIVAEMPISVGNRVKRGDPLFRIDDREARAELAVRESALTSARAELARLEGLPRAEDLPPAEARVAAAQ